VIDLTAVRAMGNQGVAVLVGARARQRSRGQGMSLIYLPGSVTARALSRAGLGSAFPSRQS
jgi:anti-anti-sigma regulatory factor